MNLFYDGQENLYKVRSIKEDKVESKNIIVKFIPDVQTYFDFEKYLNGLKPEESEKEISKIDSPSVLKFFFINLLMCASDLNPGNILIKNIDNKNKVIPIDFSWFVLGRDQKKFLIIL